MTIGEIKERLKETINDPMELTELYARLSSEYSSLCDIISEVSRRRPQSWNEIRKDCTSDKQADRKWEMTQDGTDYIAIKNELKGLQKLLSDTRMRIVALQDQSRNLY